MADRVSSMAALALLAGLGIVSAPAAHTPNPARDSARQPSLSLRTGAFGRTWEMPSWQPDLLARGGGLPRPAPPLDSGDSWNIEPTPNPASLKNASIASESCTGPSDCTTVGSFVNAAGATVPLVERWDGSRWRVQRAAAPAGAVYGIFTGVSCAAHGRCEAVGYYFTGAGNVLTLAEAWNGRRWHIQPAPSLVGPSGLFALSCTSPRACTAVGVRDNSAGTSLTLAERWDGANWTVQATPVTLAPVPSTLLGVSCSGAQACTAVGALDNSAGVSVPLAMTWNGTLWTPQATVAPAHAAGSGFSGVSCSSAGACTAAGSYDTSAGTSITLAERWNGTSWTKQMVPAPRRAAGAALQAVSCASADTCVAVGEYGSSGGSAAALAVAWDGSRWRVKAPVSPGSASLLTGLSCTGPGACDAAGTFGTNADPSGQALAEAWNGARWKLQAAPSPAGANASELSADSCTSPRACVAVGFYARSANVIDTLAETWNGSVWRIRPTPNPRGASASALAGVSCASARSCTAVGQETTGAGASIALAERWNGSRWTIQVVPDPARATGVLLNEVSCPSPRTCMAVGYFYNAAGTSDALLERWNGARWKIVTAPKAAKQTQLLGVSCPSARSCTAVGYQNNGNSDLQPLAEAWNGTTWRVERVRLPLGAPGGTLASVSCTSTTKCTATGASFSSTGAPLAESWNGTRWSAEPTVAPLNYQASVTDIALLAVSCSSPLACVGVGDYTPNNFSATFGEVWSGGRWSLRFTTAPAGTEQSLLTGVSCVKPTCVAVGGYIGPSGGVVTLAESTRLPGS
jgi:hypothetical protein